VATVIFGVLCFGAAAQAWFSYPETAGKTIEEVEGLFAKVCDLLLLFSGNGKEC
jgi:hypothetical protein